MKKFASYLFAAILGGLVFAFSFNYIQNGNSSAIQEKTEEMLKAQSEMIGGDTNPVDEGDAAQLKAPDPAAAAQEKTEEMLKEEAGMIGGDTNPVDEGDAAELKAPK